MGSDSGLLPRIFSWPWLLFLATFVFNGCEGSSVFFFFVGDPLGFFACIAVGLCMEAFG